MSECNPDTQVFPGIITLSMLLGRATAHYDVFHRRRTTTSTQRHPQRCSEGGLYGVFPPPALHLPLEPFLLTILPQLPQITGNGVISKHCDKGLKLPTGNPEPTKADGAQTEAVISYGKAVLGHNNFDQTSARLNLDMTAEFCVSPAVLPDLHSFCA